MSDDIDDIFYSIFFDRLIDSIPSGGRYYGNSQIYLSNKFFERNLNENYHQCRLTPNAERYDRLNGTKPVVIEVKAAAANRRGFLLSF